MLGTERAREVSGVLSGMGAVDEELVGRYLAFWRAGGFCGFFFGGGGGFFFFLRGGGGGDLSCFFRRLLFEYVLRFHGYEGKFFGVKALLFECVVVISYSVD